MAAELRWGRLVGGTRKGPTIGRSIAFARDRSSDIMRFAEIVGILARGARILVLLLGKAGSVGIKIAGVRPAAASVPCCGERQLPCVPLFPFAFPRTDTPSLGCISTGVIYPPARRDGRAKARDRSGRRNIASRGPLVRRGIP